MIVKPSALGLQGTTATSDRVTLATIGVGWMGGSHNDAFLKVPAAQVAALRPGKVVYGEKPPTHNILVGIDAVVKDNRNWQIGSWQRPQENFRRAVELVIGLPGSHTDFAQTADKTRIGPPPPELAFDRWLGPAPVAPYCDAGMHKNWRWNLANDGGQIMDWESAGPTQIEGEGKYQPRESLLNTATKYKVTAKYAGGVAIVIARGYKETSSGTKWIGRSSLEANPKNILKSETTTKRPSCSHGRCGHRGNCDRSV